MSGFEKQTYTQVPNSLFEIMGDMDECELKVVLYVCRYTFGYHRDSVKISTRKMADAIGMNTASVQKGAELAEKRGLIERINDGQNTTEWVAIVEGVSNSDTEVIQTLTHPVSEFESQVGLNKVKQIERKEQKPKILGIEAAIFSGRPVEQADLDPQGTNKFAPIIEELTRRFSVNFPNYGENPKWDRVVRNIQKDGKSIETFCNWAIANKRDPGWYFRMPDSLWADWPQAFAEAVAAPKKDAGGGSYV